MFDLSRSLRETLSIGSGLHSARSRGKASTDAAASHESDAALDGALRPLPWGERAERLG